MTAHDVTVLAHEWIAAAVETGGLAVDATAGNGHDTRFLARAVGPAGAVHAFDIQREAIEGTRRALRGDRLAGRVHLHLACHSQATACLPARPLDAVMFNLGWLPGGRSSIVTRPRTTLTALDGLLRRLRPGGRLSVIAYRGHAGGDEEERAVAAWFDARPDCARPLLVQAASPSSRAPVLRVVQRA